MKRLCIFCLLICLLTGACLPAGASWGDSYGGVRVGDIVLMGAYEQDNNTYNGTEPIEWQVLEISGNRALLISLYGLDAVAYHTRRTSITWETSSIRGWLNYDFPQKAFSWSERQALVQTYVENGSVHCNPDPAFVHEGGNDTWDTVFLLSYREAMRYFGSDYERRCAPTTYAWARGAYRENGYYTARGDISGSWWLRSPGMKQDQASAITVGGAFNRDGIEHASDAVRPAMWVNLDLCSFGTPGQGGGWVDNGGGPAVPYAWDTQFKAGAAYNDKAINMLGRIHDGQPTPAFYYTNWRSQRTDSIPEFTAYFGGASLHRIGIINGSTLSPGEYSSKARVKEMRVVVHTSYGDFGQYFNVADVFSQNYQYFELTCQGAVSSVDIYIIDIYQGDRDTYEVNIGEIAFQ